MIITSSLALSSGTDKFSHKLLARILFDEGDIEGQ